MYYSESKNLFFKNLFHNKVLMCILKHLEKDNREIIQISIVSGFTLFLFGSHSPKVITNL